MIKNNLDEVALPSDFEGYFNQLVQAILRAKQTGNTSFADKAYVMVIDAIKGAKTYSPDNTNPVPKNNPDPSKLNEALNNFKRLF